MSFGGGGVLTQACADTDTGRHTDATKTIPALLSIARTLADAVNLAYKIKGQGQISPKCNQC